MNRMNHVTLICLALVGAVTAADWNYTDISSWSNHYKSCSKTSQSPINIKSVTAKVIGFPDFDFSKFGSSGNSNLTNNGHTVQLTVNGGTLNGGKLNNIYKVLQLHFHWAENSIDRGSEHSLNDKFYPLEMHIVHMNTKYPDVQEALKHSDGLAVLGFFYKVDDNSNQYLEKITPNVDKVSASGMTIKDFDLKGLISATDLTRFYRYNGSLTTPPCSEAVIWTVFAEPLMISKAQYDHDLYRRFQSFASARPLLYNQMHYNRYYTLKKFWGAKDSHNHGLKNFRPIQKMNGRTIYASFQPKSSSGMTNAFSVLIIFSLYVTNFS